MNIIKSLLMLSKNCRARVLESLLEGDNNRVVMILINSRWDYNFYNFIALLS